MVQKLQDPLVDPTYYRKLVFTATLFAGVLQTAFGLLRIVKWATQKVETRNDKENASVRIHLVVLDMSSLLNIDTSGIKSLSELQKELASQGIEFSIANPRWQITEKLKLANYVGEVDHSVFLTVREAVDAYIVPKMADV